MSYLVVFIFIISFFKQRVFIVKLRKVMIIGVRNVGSTIAYTLVNRGICEEIVNLEQAYGHAQDLLDAAAYRLN